MDEQQIGMCGAYCGICEWKEKTNCPGCQACKGDMFYGECGVAKCCHGKGLLHCGLCPDLPCAKLQEAFDHPEHGDHGERLANLKNWAKGDDTVIELRSFLKGEWETERCLVLEAQEEDLPTMASIFAGNVDAVRSQGPDCQPERLASILLRHEGLPPEGKPSQEQTFLIVEKASKRSIGLLSFYCGYPTDTTLYVGSLFFLPDWQGRGLGREVIEYLERRARQKGYEEAYVAVGLKNWPALRFWVALGFNHISGIAGGEQNAETAYADVELTKNLKEET